MDGGQTDWDQRFRPLITVVPYVALVLMAALTVAFKHDQPGSYAIDLALCAAAAVWSLALFTVHPAWRERTGVMGLFLAGLILFGLVMVVRNPWFGFYTPVLYFYAFRIIGWPRELYFITGVAVVAGTAQSTGVDLGSWLGRLGYLAVVAVNVVPMCLVAWIGESGMRHFGAREAALREAREANARLAAALKENAALQERLVEQARAAGVLDERARMAREIHDTLAQGLTGIVTQLQAAEHAADEPAAWRRHHAAATALARESLTEARRSVNELRPEPLETGRLADAISEVAAKWSERHGISADVTVTGVARVMRPEAEVALLRMAQEALANVAKHAATASRVGLTLSYMDQETALDVRDDGQGFDLTTLASGASLSGGSASGGSASGGSASGGSSPGGSASGGSASSGSASSGSASGGSASSGSSWSGASMLGASSSGASLGGAPPRDSASSSSSSSSSASSSSSSASSAGASPRAFVRDKSDLSDSDQREGFGLVAMRQRIEALSGTLQIESEVGGGTGISACLPAEASEVRS